MQHLLMKQGEKKRSEAPQRGLPVRPHAEDSPTRGGIGASQPTRVPPPTMGPPRTALPTLPGGLGAQGVQSGGRQMGGVLPGLERLAGVGQMRAMFEGSYHALPPVPGGEEDAGAMAVGGKAASSRGKKVPPVRPLRPSVTRDMILEQQIQEKQKKKQQQKRQPLAVETDLSRTASVRSTGTNVSTNLPPVPTNSPATSSLPHPFALDFGFGGNRDSRASARSTATTGAMPYSPGHRKSAGLSMNSRVQSIIQGRGLHSIQTGVEETHHDNLSGHYSAPTMVAELVVGGYGSHFVSGPSYIPSVQHHIRGPSSSPNVRLSFSGQAHRRAQSSRTLPSLPSDTTSIQANIRPDEVETVSWDPSDPKLWMLPTYKSGPIRILRDFGLYAIADLTSLHVLYDPTTDEEVWDDLVTYFELFDFPRTQLISNLDRFWMREFKFTTRGYQRPAVKGVDYAMGSGLSYNTTPLRNVPNLRSAAPLSPAHSFRSNISTSNVSIEEVYKQPSPEVSQPQSPTSPRTAWDNTEVDGHGAAKEKGPLIKLPPSNSPSQTSPLSPHWIPKHRPTNSQVSAAESTASRASVTSAPTQLQRQQQLQQQQRHVSGSGVLGFLQSKSSFFGRGNGSVGGDVGVSSASVRGSMSGTAEAGASGTASGEGTGTGSSTSGGGIVRERAGSTASDTAALAGPADEAGLRGRKSSKGKQQATEDTAGSPAEGGSSGANARLSFRKILQLNASGW